jgi:hypothetical protein
VHSKSGLYSLIEPRQRSVGDVTPHRCSITSDDVRLSDIGREDGNFGLALGAHERAALAHNLQLGINVQMLRDMLFRRAVLRIAPKAPYRQTNGNNTATDDEIDPASWQPPSAPEMQEDC